MGFAELCTFMGAYFQHVSVQLLPAAAAVTRACCACGLLRRQSASSICLRALALCCAHAPSACCWPFTRSEDGGDETDPSLWVLLCLFRSGRSGWCAVRAAPPSAWCCYALTRRPAPTASTAISTAARCAACSCCNLWAHAAVLPSCLPTCMHPFPPLLFFFCKPPSLPSPSPAVLPAGAGAAVPLGVCQGCGVLHCWGRAAGVGAGLLLAGCKVVAGCGNHTRC